MNAADLKLRFGRRVQALREAAELTQDELAERIDRTPDTVGNIERGINSTRIETAYQLAGVFGLELWQLFDFGEVDPAPTRGQRRAVEIVVKKLEGLDQGTIAAIGRLVQTALDIRDRREA